MSTRTVLRPYPVFNAVSMAANQTSSVTVLQSLTRVTYQVFWTGTSPVGTLSVQASNNYQANGSVVLVAGTWSTLTFLSGGTNVTSVPVTGNSGDGVFELTTAMNAIRLVYTFTSGIGSLTAFISGKVS